MAVVTDTNFEVSVLSGSTYHCSITAKDEINNTKAYEVFSFTVQ